MLIYDIYDNIIEAPDLTTGTLMEAQRIRRDVVPIDNVTKFAYEENDFEPAYVYVPNKEREISPYEVAYRAGVQSV